MGHNSKSSLMVRQEKVREEIYPDIESIVLRANSVYDMVDKLVSYIVIREVGV